MDQHKLFRDEDTLAAMDFTDGVTAPVSIKAAYGVGDPEDIEGGYWDKVTESVRLYTYRYTDPKERIDALIDGALRPRLQSLTSDEAQKNTDRECAAAANAVSNALEKIGVYLSDEEALIVEDIGLPEEVIAIRQQELKGKKDAIAEQARLAAPAHAILAVRDALRAGGLERTDAEIVQMLMTQQGLEAIRGTGANVTLVGKDVGGLLNLIGVGKGA